MKYNPDSYSEYPILRPNSDDYPDGQFATSLSLKEISESSNSEANIQLRLDFSIDESAIENEIKDGDAICCAHLYCTATCYSEMLVANKGNFFVESLVSLGNVRGRVELRPLVLTINDIAIKTQTAHPEYGGNMLPVSRYKQLAVCEPYHFTVGFIGAIESVFRLEKISDEVGLERGEFEYEADISQRYIRIKMNPETYEDFQGLRAQESLTQMTVYLNALTNALLYLPEEADDDEMSEGWVSTIREHLRRRGIDVPNGHSYGLAAQKLLDIPLKNLPYIMNSMEENEAE